MKGKLYFDCAAFAVMLVVIIYHWQRSKQKNIHNEIFKVLSVATFAGLMVAITDDYLVLVQRNEGVIYALIDSLHAILLLVITLAYGFYIISVAELIYKVKEKTSQILLAVFPFALSVVLIFCTFFSAELLGDGNVGYISFHVIKTILVDVTLIYYAIGELISLYRIREIMGKSKAYAYSIPIFLVASSLLLGVIYPKTQSVYFVISMCFLLISLLNKHTEGTVDMNTGFKTPIAFADEIRSVQYSGRDCTIIIIDVINYDSILNAIGYAVLENAIIELSTLITRVLKSNKITGHECYYDENGAFYILFPYTSTQVIQNFADVVQQEIIRNSDIGENGHAFLANVCLVSMPQDVDDVDTLLMLSKDLAAMPHTLHVLSAKDLTRVNDFAIRKRMNMIIDSAIANNHFSVYYQPIYSIHKDKFISAEALIRLNDPEHGFISPAIFIPLAEKSGAIHKIGSFVLEEVCRFIASDEFKNLGVEYIEINLSAAQCLRVDLVDEITSLTEKYGISPSQINLEITETAACYSQNRLLNNIRTLHSSGYTFSLDDFGTGYSNLMRMVTLPLDIVKLDRAFVLMDEDEKFHSIIKNMVRLFKKMGLKILVEGIETKEMVERFMDMEVDYIQGYYYSKPLPEREYVSFIKQFT